MEGEDLLFFFRQRDRCLDQLCLHGLVFKLVGTSLGESLLEHSRVEEIVLQKHLPIPIKHSGEEVGIVARTVHQALIFESIQNLRAVSHPVQMPAAVVGIAHTSPASSFASTIGPAESYLKSMVCPLGEEIGLQQFEIPVAKIGREFVHRRNVTDCRLDHRNCNVEFDGLGS